MQVGMDRWIVLRGYCTDGAAGNLEVLQCDIFSIEME
jgi:hypothetical protein